MARNHRILAEAGKSICNGLREGFGRPQRINSAGHEKYLSSCALDRDCRRSLLRPEFGNGLGVVVLAGSSGRVDQVRANLFATRGAVALAMRWFGGEGQICEIPLEGFTPATDKLIDEGCERIAYIGTSKGAEAAMLAAVANHRVDAVVAISPSSVVWANIGPGRDGQTWPQRSSWTRNGVPLHRSPLRVPSPTVSSIRRACEHSLPIWLIR
jgi:hypothetical protein